MVPTEQFLKHVRRSDRRLSLSIISIALVMIHCTNSRQTPPVPENLQEKSLEVLRTVLHTETEWVKVHAAEYLLWAGYGEGVKEVFLKEEKARGSESPYRIGIWRVLVQASDGKEREYWLARILEAFLDEDGADRIHAAETLAKLRASPATSHPAVVERVLQGSDERLRSYTRWSIMFTSADSFATGRSAFMNAFVDPDAKKGDKEVAACVLARTAEFSSGAWTILGEVALHEAKESTTRLYMLTAAFITAPDSLVSSDLYADIRLALAEYEHSMAPAVLSELAYALARRGNDTDALFLGRLLNKEHQTGSPAGDADVSAAAAFALIQIGSRSVPTLNDDE